MEVTGAPRNPIAVRHRRRFAKKKVNINSKNLGKYIRPFVDKALETKIYTTNANAFVPTAGVLVEITGIAQGLTQQTRTGNLIHPVRLTGRFLLEMGTSANKVRVSIIKQIGTEEPTAGGLAVTLNNMWDLDKFLILMDKCLTQPGNDERVVEWSFNKSLRYKGYPMKTQYDGAGTSNCIRGRIWLWIRGDIADTASYWYGIRLFFKDG